MKALARRLLCALLMVAQCALPVWAAPLYDTASTDESRLALVIGNSAYLVDPLDNPVNDANAVARSLERLGFEVMLAINLPGAELKRRVRTFQARARAERGTALVYYAGHAVAPAGRNILLPVDINFRDVLGALGPVGGTGQGGAAAPNPMLHRSDNRVGPRVDSLRGTAGNGRLGTAGIRHDRVSHARH